jgi:hypothetical protein
MGFRTIPLLANDLAHEWGEDPELGALIQRAMNYTHDKDPEAARIGNYGYVLECTHADTQTLLAVDGYRGKPVAWSHWRRGDEEAAMHERLLRDMADRLGYRLVKKAK